MPQLLSSDGSELPYSSYPSGALHSDSEDESSDDDSSGEEARTCYDLYQDDERTEDEAEQREVCGITGDPTENTVLIGVDSGSDAHCCPLDYCSHLGEKVGEGHVLRDAQGKEIPHKGYRSTRHLLQGEGGE